MDKNMNTIIYAIGSGTKTNPSIPDQDEGVKSIYCGLDNIDKVISSAGTITISKIYAINPSDDDWSTISALEILNYNVECLN